MTINRLNQGTTNQVLVKAISGQTTNLLELQDSSGNVVSSIGPTGALGGTISQPQGLVHIETQTFTSVSGFSFSNDVFTNDYQNYRLLIEIATTASPAGLRWRGRIAGSDTSLTNYNDQNLIASSTTVSAGRNTGQNSGFLGDIFSANPQNAVAVDIFGPKVAERTKVLCHNLNSDFNIRLALAYSSYTLTTSFDSLTIFGSTGNITGKAFLYGYRN